MHKLMEYICDELEELERKADKEGKLSMAEIEYVDKLAHIKKSLLSAEEMWEDSEYNDAGSEGGQSHRGGSSYARGGNRGRSYDGGSSYARGRGRNAKRDSMGRYSREGGSYNYSMAEDDFRMDLEELMQSAPNEQIKQKLQRMMSEM